MENATMSQYIQNGKLLIDHIAAGRKSFENRAVYFTAKKEGDPHGFERAKSCWDIIVEDATKHEVFLIDDIVEWHAIESDAKRHIPAYNEMSIKPPFKAMWLEFNIGFISAKLSSGSDEVTTRNRKAYSVKDITDVITQNEKNKLVESGDFKIDELNEHGIVKIVDISTYTSGEIIVVNGAFICTYDKETGKFVHGVYFSFIADKDKSYGNAALLMSSVINTIDFLHSPSIGTKTHQPDPGLSKANKKRFKLPLAVFKTLTVRTKAGEFPFKETLSCEKSNGPRGEGTPLHKVRGHWKHYTEDRKLFGKLTGKFWHEAHERGDIESGVILKDYLVK
jgi:hypothetical protein